MFEDHKAPPIGWAMHVTVKCPACGDDLYFSHYAANDPKKHVYCDNKACDLRAVHYDIVLTEMECKVVEGD
jgi:hypothetical protein